MKVCKCDKNNVMVSKRARDQTIGFAKPFSLDRKHDKCKI